MSDGPIERVPLTRLAIFATGDFAFNLYWQSAMLYLLFYYTDALGIGIGAATTIYLIGSVWDGAVSFVIGLLADRRGSIGAYRRAIFVGAMPLGLAFILAYLPPASHNVLGLASVLGVHLLFRAAYAAVNIPYLTLSSRISASSADRALVAGLRMLAGTGAAILVAIGTVPIGGWLTGLPGKPAGFLATAVLFAIAASVILPLAVLNIRDLAPVTSAPHPPMRAALQSLAANRAFTTLAAAMIAMIAAVTMLNKSVLYYFKYALGDETAGQIALGVMMGVSVIALPLWMALSRLIGGRALWFVALAIAGAGLTIFTITGIAHTRAMQLLLVMLQTAIVGMHFAFWSLLPDTIEYGQRTTGLRVEGTTFGLVTLLQRCAIGIATAAFGWSLGAAGFVANHVQGQATLLAMRQTVSVAPLILLAVSAWLMWLNPLRKGAHDRIVRELSV